jgi:hypothetical protein
MVFQPGQSGNPKGRTPHYPPVKVKLKLALANSGNPVSRAFLRAVAVDDDLPVPYRLQATQKLIEYEESRCTVRRITKSVHLPPPISVEQASANLATISDLASRAVIGLDEAADLANLQKAAAEVLVGSEIATRLQVIEAALRGRETIEGAVTMAVDGGLPSLPGTDIVMPAKLALDEDRE